MEAEEFRNKILDECKEDYGMCAPPLNAQVGLDILMTHFLGDNWYTTLSICNEQVNTEAVYEILRLYPRKESMFVKINKVYQNWYGRVFK